MTDDEIQDRLSPVDATALTAWAEARGDGREGHSSVEERIAVLWVIRNRAARRHQTWKAVCFAPRQFSCWEAAGGAENHRAVMALASALVAGATIHDELYVETRYLAEGVIRGLILDRSGGADHYYAPAAMRPAGWIPAWARGRTPAATVGGQVFFNLDGRAVSGKEQPRS